MGEFHLHNTEKNARRQKWPSILLQPKNCSKRNFRRKSPTKTSCRTANSEVPGHWRSALLQRVQSPNLPVQISALLKMSQLKKISTSKCRFTICSSKCSGGKVPPGVPPQYKFFDLRVDGPWPIQNNLLDKTCKTYMTYKNHRFLCFLCFLLLKLQDSVQLSCCNVWLLPSLGAQCPKSGRNATGPDIPLIGSGSYAATQKFVWWEQEIETPQRQKNIPA